MDLNLRGRTALITGGARDIGLAIAEQLAAEGVNLVLTSRSPEALEAARRNLTARHKIDVQIAVHDLGEANAIDALVSSFPGIDILINNANAPRQNMTLESATDEQWAEAWRIKSIATMRLMRAYMPLMRARGGGVVINIIGVRGQFPAPDAIVQSTACAALIALTRAVGVDSPKSNIRVVGVNSGPVSTERAVTRLREIAHGKWGDAERWRELQAKLPFGRAAEPEEVASLIAFLASDRAAYITGTTVTIDGGLQ